MPVKLLHEGEGHPVTVEMKTGEIYKGRLTDAEDSMNCQLSDVTMVARDGQLSKLEHCYLRGSQIRFFVLPDLLKNAPMFKRVQKVKEAREEAAKAKKKGTSLPPLPSVGVSPLGWILCPNASLGHGVPALTVCMVMCCWRQLLRPPRGGPSPSRPHSAPCPVCATHPCPRSFHRLSWGPPTPLHFSCIEIPGCTVCVSQSLS